MQSARLIFQADPKVVLKASNKSTWKDSFMVARIAQHTELNGPPPPADDTWWESVLSEEEMIIGSASSRSYRPVSNLSQWDDHRADLISYAAVDWNLALDLYEKDQVVQLVVTNFNRGGLLVGGDSLQGFVPISHLIQAPCPDKDVEDFLGRYLDRPLELKVIECDRERGRIVFSERAAQSDPGSRNILLQKLSPGCCTTGIVTNITDFGVFVDLGGIEGLVHVSEISWGRVQHPTEVVSLGENVLVYVIQVDPKRARVALSLKRLHSNPWETAQQRYRPGQIVDAVITSIVPFGAFARIEDGLDGLIHVSEMSGENESDETEDLFNGKHVKTRILHVDALKQRLGLSLKLVEEE
jgi:small subunit ribosomal protein S1